MDSLIFIFQKISAMPDVAIRQQTLGPHLMKYEAHLNDLCTDLVMWSTPVSNSVTGIPAAIVKNRKLWEITANKANNLPSGIESMLDLQNDVTNTGGRIKALNAIRNAAIASLQRSQDITDAEIRPLFEKFIEQNNIKLDNKPVTAEQMNPRRIARLIDLLEKQPVTVVTVDVSMLLDQSSNTDNMIQKLLIEQHGSTNIPLNIAITSVKSYAQIQPVAVSASLDKERIVEHLRSEQGRIRDMQFYISGLRNLVTTASLPSVGYAPVSHTTIATVLPINNIIALPDGTNPDTPVNDNISMLINMDALTNRYNAITAAINAMIGNCCNCGETITACTNSKYNYCSKCNTSLEIERNKCPMSLYEHRYRSINRSLQPDIQRYPSPVNGSEFSTNTVTSVVGIEQD